MVYSVIGLMSGSSLDGLDIVHAQFHFDGRKWSYEIRQAACYPYPENWLARLGCATKLNAAEYLALDAAYGHYLGQEVNRFIREQALEFQVQLISSHGHTVFHDPARQMTAQLGHGAAIAAETGINTITELRSADIALGGQGAPIVPIGEKLILGDYPFYLNLGGIANLSAHLAGNSDKEPNQHPQPEFIAFDICPANRILNMIAAGRGKTYDENGAMASRGKPDADLLARLNAFPYYEKPFPKSLDNAFGVEQVFPLVSRSGLSAEDQLSTYTDHICLQIARAVKTIRSQYSLPGSQAKMLVCGGGAHNLFLVSRLREILAEQEVEPEIPSKELVDFKEALIMAFMGVLRWREESNILHSVTGAKRDSVSGAVWIGQES